ncbi:ATP-dependent RNA helicase [Vairimorpha necatrix]|uniref:ATP-dependent RNA helicase n=1 Tax=Vairimorpha necatrix TaxID=6039 RepID=A0AAX4J8I7_9MICR
MDEKEAILNILKSKEIDLSNDFFNKIYKFVQDRDMLNLQKHVSEEVYNEILALVENNRHFSPEQVFQIDDDIEMRYKIPKNLYIDTFVEYKPEKDADLDILNFLNNEADIEDRAQYDSVESKMDLIIKLLEENRIVLVQGDTGCGKTTKIPKYLLKKYSNIVCTQPRRIAAISIAKKVAKDMNTKIGKLVGYAVRFDDCTSKKTKLKYVTDGILLKEIVRKETLNKYDCLIIDEAHERTINIDILLGYCKKILNSNSKTKIVLMSATLATQKFIEFFNCPFVDIRHKIFPLQNYFIKQYENENWFEETIKTVIQIHNFEPPGDILVFLTGQEDIKEAFGILNSELGRESCEILTIYSAMSAHDQERVFLKTDKRKIILSTNICETSITIENIVYVVDSGRVKHMRHSNNLGMDILETVMISKAQAKQRSGRAGRTKPGKTFRIYTKQDFNKMADFTPPEILTTNVCSGILTIKSLGIDDLSTFDMIDKPKVDSINDALEYLFLTRAVDKNGKITKLGLKMSSLPLDPNLALTLIRSVELKCFQDTAIISAMLTIDQIFIDVSKENKNLYKKFLDSKKIWYDERGDFFVLLKIFKEWQKNNFSENFSKKFFLSFRNLCQAKKIVEQLSKIFCTDKSSDISKVMEAFSYGYFMNIAKIKEEGYFTVFKETECFIHSSSCLYKKRENLILYFSIVRTKKEFLKYCNVVSSEILCKSVNHLFHKKK